MSSLREAVIEYRDRSGSVPTNLTEVLAAGGEIQPGTQVKFAGLKNGSFCIRVGAIGERPTDDPLDSVMIHRRPPGVETWTSTCRFPKEGTFGAAR
jgi:hypothetical protein